MADLRPGCLPHPTYSSDLVPCDYHVFGPPKKFSTDKVIKEVLHSWLQDQLEDSFFSRNPGISEAGGRPALNVTGIMQKNDTAFPVMFVYFNEKQLKLLF